MIKNPKQYIKQPPYRYCWHCQIKIIKEFFAYQKNQLNVDKHFLFYAPNQISRISGFILPKVMRKHLIKMNMDVKKIKMQKSQNIFDIYKKEIDQWRIVLMTVWHWYKSDKNKFNIVKWILLQHWISIWWYDENGVYIYDSSCFDKNDLPTGNLHLSREIFRKAYKFSILKTILSIHQN